MATTNPYTYAYKGPPFNWLGHVSETQWKAFNGWYDALGITAPPSPTPTSPGSTSTSPTTPPNTGTSTPATPQTNAATNTNAVALATTIIKGYEGKRLTAYPDPAGQTVTYSIGYGHQIVAGDGLSSTSTITDAQADALLTADVQKSNNAVTSSITVPLNADQEAALTSLAFNLGGAGFANRTITKDLNSGNTAQGAADFNLYVNSGGVVNQNLVSRRTSEQALFSKGVILTNSGNPVVAANNSNPTNASNTTNVGSVVTPQIHYQIRAQQLRKTAGALEQHYQTANDDNLAATFTKAAWQPPQSGYFQYAHRDDHLPMVAMGQIKSYLKDRLQRQDDSVFHMNHARNIIEKVEDKAQYQLDAKTQIPNLIAQINNYFSLPQYAPVLVKDQSDVYPAGSTTPRYRVHELDNPTVWELEQAGRALPGGPVNLKETPQPTTSQTTG